MIKKISLIPVYLIPLTLLFAAGFLSNDSLADQLSPDYAEWTLLEKTELGDAFYIAPKTIIKLGNYYRAETRLILDTRYLGSSGFYSAIDLKEYDCKNRKIRLLRSTSYYIHGQSRVDEQGTEWNDVTVHALDFDYVCNPKP